MNWELMEINLRQRLAEMHRIVKRLERYYKGDTSYYQDYLDSINAIEESLLAMP